MKAWVWTCVAATFTVFALRTTRAATMVQQLLGKEFDGTVECDRVKMDWSLSCLQWCRAHLKRDFQALIGSDHPQQDCPRNRLTRRFDCRMQPLGRGTRATSCGPACPLAQSRQQRTPCG